MIWPMAPLTPSHSLQSSTFVPTSTSTPAADPAAITSSGAPGRTSPSMTGCHGMLPRHYLLAPAGRIRVAEQVRLQLSLRSQQSADPDLRDGFARRLDTEPVHQ